MLPMIARPHTFGCGAGEDAAQERHDGFGALGAEALLPRKFLGEKRLEFLGGDEVDEQGAGRFRRGQAGTCFHRRAQPVAPDVVIDVGGFNGQSPAYAACEGSGVLRARLEWVELRVQMTAIAPITFLR